MTRCRSTTNRQLAQRQSLQRHWRLCPLRHDTTPWLRHRAHFGVLSNRRDDANVVTPPAALVDVDGGWFRFPWLFEPQRWGVPQSGCSSSGSSSEQPSMSRYSSEASLSEAVFVKALVPDIVDPYKTIGLPWRPFSAQSIGQYRLNSALSLNFPLRRGSNATDDDKNISDPFICTKILSKSDIPVI